MTNDKSDWLFIAPIRGVVLSASINEELKIENVLFVSQRKLPIIRKRLKIPMTISEFPNI